MGRVFMGEEAWKFFPLFKGVFFGWHGEMGGLDVLGAKARPKPLKIC
jgi:hypothetical protein